MGQDQPDWAQTVVTGAGIMGGDVHSAYAQGNNGGVILTTAGARLIAVWAWGVTILNATGAIYTPLAGYATLRLTGGAGPQIDSLRWPTEMASSRPAGVRGRTPEIMMKVTGATAVRFFALYTPLA